MKGNGLYLTSAVILLFVAFFSIVHSYSIRQVKDISAYQDLLSKYTVRERVFVHGEPVDVEHGSSTASRILPKREQREVLQLAYAATIVRRSAPLALPGTSLLRLEGTVERLRLTREELALIQKTPEAADDVRNALLPLHALQELTELERKRRAFLDHPSELTLTSYSIQFPRALRVYEKDLESYMKVYQKYIRAKKIPPHRTATGTVTSERTYKILEEALKNVRILRADSKKYRGCLSGRLSVCDDSWIALPSLEVLEPVNVSPPDETTVALAYSLLSKAFGEHVKKGARIRVPSACTEEISAPFEYIAPVFEESDAFPRPIRELEDIYFFDLDTERSRESDVSNEFVESGARYAHYPLIAPHVCHETQRDVSRVLGIDELYLALQTLNPAYVRGISSGTSENTYIASEKTRKALENLLRERPEFLTATSIHQFEDLMLGIEYETIGFDKHLSAIADIRRDHLHGYANLLDTPVDLSTLLRGWDAMYSTLLLFHSSVNPDRLLLTDKTRASDGRGVIRRLSELRMFATEADLLCGFRIVQLYHQGEKPTLEICSKK